jgi:hypothetical protein
MSHSNHTDETFMFHKSKEFIGCLSSYQLLNEKPLPWILLRLLKKHIELSFTAV